MNIQTLRLELLPANAALVRLEIGDHARFGQAISAYVPLDWPPESTRDALGFFARMLEASPELQGWMNWYWIARSEKDGQRTLVGGGGFMGKPDANGVVEVGYSVLPGFQNQGYATEALQALAAWALSQEEVRQVIAETTSENLASARVLEKCGFVAMSVGAAPDLLRFRFQKKRGFAKAKPLPDSTHPASESG